MGAAASAVAFGVPLLERLVDARRRTDDLFALVQPAALYDRPIAERHRIIFYLGHLEAFDGNLFWPIFGMAPFDPAPFDPTLDRLFAFGIDPVNGALPDDQPKDWPSPEATRGYARRARGAVDQALAAWPRRSAEKHREITQSLHVAIEHRLMHAETLAYMLHQLPYDRKSRSGWDAILPAPPAPAVAPRMIEIPAGAATLGLKLQDDGPFGWDNEFEEHAVSVPAFRIDACKVTNGEFLKFLGQDGYRHRTLWNEADWDWLQSSGVSHPAFWVRRGEPWLYRTMFEEIPLPLDWPVYVSHAEAAAYARWAGKELPSEAEWHRAAYGAPDGSERAYPWGDQPPEAARGNFDFYRWDPAPAAAFPAGASAFGVADLAGNGWEWTRSIFAPFEGFQPFPFYPGYSADFFDGRHYVLKGGSARTAACMLRRSFRNWFQPHYGYVYAGFRCVER